MKRQDPLMTRHPDRNHHPARQYFAPVGVFLTLAVISGAHGQPCVRDLVDALDTTNHEIRIAALQADEARGAIRVARARRFPTIEAATGGYLLGNPPDPIMVRKGSFGTLPLGSTALDLPMEDLTVFEGQDAVNYSVSLSVTQPVFTWGKISRTVRLRQSEFDAAQAGTDRVRIRARTELLRNVFSMRYLDELIEVAIRLDTLSLQLVESSGDALQAGQITTLDHTTNRIEARESGRRRVELQARKQALLEQIGLITGAPSHLLTGLQYGRTRSWMDLSIPDQPQVWIDEALQSSPEIRALTAARLARQHALGLARSSAPLHPDLALSVQGGYGKGATGLSMNMSGKADHSLIVGVMLKGEIFDGGAASGTIAQRIAALKQSEVSLDHAHRQMSAGLTQGWMQLSDLREEIEYRTSRVELYDELYRELLIRSQAGAASPLEAVRKQIDHGKEHMLLLEKHLAYSDLYIQLVSRLDPERFLGRVLMSGSGEAAVTRDVSGEDTRTEQ